MGQGGWVETPSRFDIYDVYLNLLYGWAHFKLNFQP